MKTSGYTPSSASVMIPPDEPPTTYTRFASRLARGEIRFGAAPKLLDLGVDAYYAAPEDNFRRLYECWLDAQRPVSAFRNNLI